MITPFAGNHMQAFDVISIGNNLIITAEKTDPNHIVSL
jgi:hypothetical protein